MALWLKWHNVKILPDEDYLHENILKPGEIVTEFEIPDLPAKTVSGYLKFKERAVWDFAVVSAAAVIRKNGNAIQSGSVALGGVAPIPWQEEPLNQKLSGLSIEESALKEWSNEALKDDEPLSMNGYKVRLSRNLLKRLVINLTG